MIKTEFSILTDHLQSLKEVYNLVPKNENNSETVNSEDVIEVLDQVSIVLSKDLESAAKYFELNNDYITQEINLR